MTTPHEQQDDHAWSEAGDAEFVSLGTHRRDGSLVETPVWVARSGGELVVVTSSATGKVRRLRRDARAELRVCDRRGRVAPGTPTVLATGRVVGPVADDPEAVAALRAAYGVQLALVLGLQRVAGLVGRLRRRRGATQGERVILRLQPRDG